MPVRVPAPTTTQTPAQPTTPGTPAKQLLQPLNSPLGLLIQELLFVHKASYERIAFLLGRLEDPLLIKIDLTEPKRTLNGFKQLFKISENRFSDLIRPKTHESLVNLLTAATFLPKYFEMKGRANFDAKYLKLAHGDVIDANKTTRSMLWDCTILSKILQDENKVHLAGKLRNFALTDRSDHTILLYMVGLWLLVAPDGFQLAIPLLCKREKEEILSIFTLSDLHHSLLFPQESIPEKNDEPQPEPMQLESSDEESSDDETRQEYDPADPAY